MSNTNSENNDAVGLDYGQTNEVPNDANPKIPSGAPEGEVLGYVESSDEVSNSKTPVKDEINALGGGDYGHTNEVPNDANPKIPSGAPEGEVLGYALPTSIREDTVEPFTASPNTEVPVLGGEIDTTNGQADSSRAANEVVGETIPDLTQTVFQNVDNATKVSVSEGLADSTQKKGLPDRSLTKTF